MKKEIYKVTSKRVLKMIENVDYLDCRSHIVDLSNQSKISLEQFNDVVNTPMESSVFTYDKNLTKTYQILLKTRERA